MELKNDLLLRAARGEVTERPPVWMMRQAGRILKEYREVRNSVNGFRELVETPELAAKVTLQPVDIFGVDAAIIFSDILVVTDLVGFPYRMEPGKGPVFDKTLRSEKDLEPRKAVVEEELDYVGKALGIAKKELNGRVPLIGFAGAPWTLFSYIVEGEGSKTFSEARKLLYQQPELAHKVLERIADITIEYLKFQIRNGADIVQVFDSWAGILGEEQYREFGSSYIRRICSAIEEVPVIVFAKGAHNARKDLKEHPCEVIGLDWTMNIEESRSIIGKGKALQGNMDPAMLYADSSVIQKETRKMVDRFNGHPYIANLGHGVYPDTEPEKVQCFVDTIKEYKPQEK